MATETHIVTLYQGLEEQKRVPISPRTHAKAVTDDDGVTLDKKFNDYIVEQGTSDGWTYRKWKSGLMEMWGSISGIADVNTPWSSVYRSSLQINKAYPISFVEVPNVTLGFETPAGNWHWIMANSQGFTTATPMYMLMSASSQSSVSYKLNFHVRGKWK